MQSANTLTQVKINSLLFHLNAVKTLQDRQLKTLTLIYYNILHRYICYIIV